MMHIGQLALLLYSCLALWMRVPRPQTSTLPATYEHSLEGLQRQVNDAIQANRTGDAAALQELLDGFKIPHADEWIAARFDSGDLPNVNADYHTQLDKFLSNLSWVLGNYGRQEGFAISMEPERLPAPPSDSGPEAEFARPTSSTPFENFRLRPSLPEDAHVPLCSFLYLDGRFRYVGYGFPFWQDGLYGLRMKTMPRLSAKLIHAVPAESPSIAKENHMRGQVKLRYMIGTDGLAHNIKIISGPAILQQAAIECLRLWRFSPGELAGMPIDQEGTSVINFP